MELAIESRQHVTWKVRDFFQLPPEISYTLDSPEIRFAGDSYCLRLFPNGSQKYEDKSWTDIHLVRLTSSFPERNVSYKFGYRWRIGEGGEVDSYWPSYKKLSILRHHLEEDTDMHVPDGTFTALLSILLKEPSTAEIRQSEEVSISDTKEEQKELPGQLVCFSSHWWSFKMELSVESPWQHVTWKVPDFFQLLSKLGNSLNSPEFRFAGDKYCLRFYPSEDKNADKEDTDIQLVRLTSTFPERIVLFKIGYRRRHRNGRETENYSGTLINDMGRCFSRSELEEYKDEHVPDGTLTVLCSMHLKAQSSAGSPQSEEAGKSHAEERQEGLPEATDSVSSAVQTETPDSVSSAVQTEILDSVSCAVETEASDSVVDKGNFENEERSSRDSEGTANL